MLVLLAALLAVGLVGVSAPAARADDTVYTEGTLYYTITNESITITGCFGKNEEIRVPAMIAGIPVNTIASGAFAENQYVKKVYLPDTISKVEPGAFGDWVKVIYNANTDHPQDTPTDLILGLLTPAASDPPEPTDPPAEQTQPTATPVTGSSTGEDTEPDPTATPKPVTTQKPSGTQTTAANATATPDPGDEVPGTAFGEDDVDADDDSKETATPAPTEAPTAEPVAEATTAPATAEPAAETSAAPVKSETATAAPVKPENPGEPEKPVSPDLPKNLRWLWVTLGAAVAVGGIATGIAVSKKAKRKES